MPVAFGTSTGRRSRRGTRGRPAQHPGLDLVDPAGPAGVEHGAVGVDHGQAGLVRGALGRRVAPGEVDAEVAGRGCGHRSTVLAADTVPMPTSSTSTRTPADLRRWRRYLADERAEAAVYRDLAAPAHGEERDDPARPRRGRGPARGALASTCSATTSGARPRTDLRTRVLGLLARRFGSVFVLALAQRAEARSPYDDRCRCDRRDGRRRAHPRGGRARARRRGAASGCRATFRAAVFGANDGLVSNLALVLGIGATGVVARDVVLLTGHRRPARRRPVDGRGRVRLGAVAARTARGVDAPTRRRSTALPDLDVDANELALVYRARGMRRTRPRPTRGRCSRARGEVLVAERASCGRRAGCRHAGWADAGQEARSADEARGHRHGASAPPSRASASSRRARSSRCCPTSSGCRDSRPSSWPPCSSASRCSAPAPWSGCSRAPRPLKRALRQLAIGFGAAAVTYLLGLLFGTRRRAAAGRARARQALRSSFQAIQHVTSTTPAAARRAPISTP